MVKPTALCKQHLVAFFSSAGKHFIRALFAGFRNSLSFLLSSFSHNSFIHLFVNMYVLMSFCKAWEQYAYMHRNHLPRVCMMWQLLLIKHGEK